MIDIETISLGLVLLTPVYSMMYKMSGHIEKMSVRLDLCKYCKKSEELKV